MGISLLQMLQFKECKLSSWIDNFCLIKKISIQKKWFRILPLWLRCSREKHNDLRGHLKDIKPKKFKIDNYSTKINNRYNITLAACFWNTNSIFKIKKTNLFWKHAIFSSPKWLLNRNAFRVFAQPECGTLE